MLVHAFIALVMLADGGSSAQPWTAWVIPSEAYVHASADRRSRPVGLLERGNEVRVRECSPDCDAARAWAMLEPFGAIPVRELSLAPLADAAPLEPAFIYGHPKAGAPVRAAPDASARELRREDGERTVAFLDDEELGGRGWAQEVSGGFVALDEVRLSVPSTFEGVRDPPRALAFALRDVKLERPDAGPDAEPALLERHAAAEVLALAPRGRVELAGGRVPRSAVRIALVRGRPVGVPAGARWIDVNLAEQTLVAYDGEAAVFATLVSAGRSDFPTRRGLFRVWFKSRHTTMVGRREPYHVEQVPDVLFFDNDNALHGAFWHDRFGRASSHGCINLSPSDARWLFAWAPPALPDGWHGVMPPPGETSLWVNVEAVDVDRALRRTASPTLAAAPAR